MLLEHSTAELVSPIPRQELGSSPEANARVLTCFGESRSPGSKAILAPSALPPAGGVASQGHLCCVVCCIVLPDLAVTLPQSPLLLRL